MRAATVILMCAGCGPQAAQTRPVDTTPSSTETTDTAAPTDVESCSSTIDVEILQWARTPYAVLVPGATETGAQGLFHLDTASALTLLYREEGSPWMEDADVVTVGCWTASVPSWGVVDPGFQGASAPVIGSLGADGFRRTPTVLDVGAGTLAMGPEQVSGVAAVPHEVVGGVYLVEGRFDGVSQLLVVDTGAGQSVWLGVSGAPGDVYTPFLDWFGEEVPAWSGPVEVEVDGQVTTVDVLKVPEFAVLDELAKQLDRPVTGLLGLSAVDRLGVDAGRDLLEIVLAYPAL